jgi:hypothetical protein
MRIGNIKPTSDIDVLFLVETDPKIQNIANIKVQNNEGAFIAPVWRNIELDTKRRYSGLVCSVWQCQLMLEHLRDEFRSNEPLNTPEKWVSAGKEKNGIRRDVINEKTWIMTALLAMEEDGVKLPDNLSKELNRTLEMFHDFRKNRSVNSTLSR